jgi:hypothetical protein
MGTERIYLSETFNKMTELLLKDTEGHWIPTEEVDLGTDPVASAVGYFRIFDSFQGTGFVIKVLPGNDPHAIILTSAHVLLDSNLEFKRGHIKFVVNGDSYEVKILSKEMNWDFKSNFPIDPISGNKLSIPNDWLFCELRMFKKEYSKPLNSLKVSNDIVFCVGTNLRVYGFPRPINRDILSYCAPNGELSELETLNTLIHGGQRLVSSKGEILSMNDEIFCISAPTSNGMSGGPIILDTDEGPKVIGILHGGPAGFLHRKLNLAIYSSNSGNFLKGMTSLLKKMLKQIRFVNNLGLRNEELLRFAWETKYVVKNLKEGRVYDIERCIDSLNSYYKGILKIEASIGNRISYNIGIFCRSFKDVQIN